MNRTRMKIMGLAGSIMLVAGWSQLAFAATLPTITISPNSGSPN